MIHYQPGYGIIIAPCAPPVFKFKYLPKIEVLPSAITRNVKKSMLSSPPHTLGCTLYRLRRCRYLTLGMSRERFNRFAISALTPTTVRGDFPPTRRISSVTCYVLLLSCARLNQYAEISMLKRRHF